MDDAKTKVLEMINEKIKLWDKQVFYLSPSKHETEQDINIEPIVENLKQLKLELKILRGIFREIN